MNAITRKALNEHISTLGAIISDLENFQSEEQDKFDNLSEGLQQAESGQKIEAAANALQSAIDYAEEVKGAIEEAAE